MRTGDMLPLMQKHGLQGHREIVCSITGYSQTMCRGKCPGEDSVFLGYFLALRREAYRDRELSKAKGSEN